MDSIQPQEIVDILKKHGTHVNAEEAKLILEFMSMIANMALDIYLDADTIEKSSSKESDNQNSNILINKYESRLIHKGKHR